MDATPFETRDGRLELADELYQRAVANAPMARDPARALPEERRLDCAELAAAVFRAQTHLARRRAELPPLSA